VYLHSQMVMLHMLEVLAVKSNSGALIVVIENV